MFGLLCEASTGVFSGYFLCSCGTAWEFGSQRGCFGICYFLFLCQWYLEFRLVLYIRSQKLGSAILSSLLGIDIDIYEPNMFIGGGGLPYPHMTAE